MDPTEPLEQESSVSAELPPVDGSQTNTPARTCPACEKPLLADQRFCAACGAEVDEINDSGQHAGVPPEIAAFRWHWGAYFLSWLWMFNHGLIGQGVITLLILIGNVSLQLAGVPLSGLIGICNLGWMIYIATHAHKLAWKNRRFEGGVPQYMKVQTAWHVWGLCTLVVPVTAIVAAILFPVFSQSKEKARATASISNLKQIGIGMMVYEQDYDDTLPPMDTYDHFKAVVHPYVKSDAVFMEPTSGKPVPYAIIHNLSNKPMASIDNPSTEEILQEPKPHNGEIATLYADGHARIVRVPSGTTR